MLKGDVHVRFTETFISHLKSFIDASLKTVGIPYPFVRPFVTLLWSSLPVYEL